MPGSLRLYDADFWSSSGYGGRWVFTCPPLSHVLPGGTTEIELDFGVVRPDGTSAYVAAFYIGVQAARASHLLGGFTFDSADPPSWFDPVNDWFDFYRFPVSGWTLVSGQPEIEIWDHTSGWAKTSTGVPTNIDGASDPDWWVAGTGPPPPPTPTVTSVTKNPLASSTYGSTYELWPGDELTVVGTDLDTITSAKLYYPYGTPVSSPVAWTPVSDTEVVLTIGPTTRTGQVRLESPGGEAYDFTMWTVRYPGPWIQPPDVETSETFRRVTGYGTTGDSSSPTYGDTQPDIEGYPPSGSFLELEALNASTRPHRDDPLIVQYQWRAQGVVMVAQADDPLYSMPPIDPPYVDDAYLVMEGTGGVATSDVAVELGGNQVGGTYSGIPWEWTDATDNKDPDDLTGDLWQTHVQFRRLSGEDWHYEYDSFSVPSPALPSNVWPSKTWIAARTLDLETLPVIGPLTIASQDLGVSPPEVHVDNSATFNVGELVDTGMAVTWDEYAAGLAWVVAFDRLVDAGLLALPTVLDPEKTGADKKATYVPSIRLTWTYRPSRYRYTYSDPLVVARAGWSVGRVAW